MGYCFNDHESISDGVKRIALEQVDKALAQINSEIKNRDQAIHDVRVSCKKVRALLRLARAKNNDRSFKNENASFRDAGRCLSDVRDTTAMIAAFDRLTNRYANQLVPDAFKQLRKSLVRAWRKQLSSKDEAIAHVARMLESARSRVTDWPIHDDGFSSLRQGSKRSYERGRTSMSQVQATPSTEHLHEWRKRVKDLGYHVRLLTPIWPGILEDLAGELERLADYLSDDHDLAILRRSVCQSPPDDRQQLEALLALIDERRGELEVEAKRVGGRMYVEKSNAFVRRFDGYWLAWARETKVDPSIVSQHN